MANEPTARRNTAKKVLHFLASVAVALVLGRITEALLQPETIEHLHAMQDQASRATQAFSPWNLASLYWCEVEKASTGLPRCSAEGEEVTGLQPLNTSNPSDIFNNYRPSPPPPQRPTGVGAMLVPLGALIALIIRLIGQPSTFGSIFALAQFIVGLLVVAAMGWGKERGRWYYLAGLPLGTVFFGCLAGWCTQLLMLAGLWLFGWFTQLAALCCGSAGLAYFGYEFCIKAVELRAHEAATHALTKS